MDMIRPRDDFKMTVARTEHKLEDVAVLAGLARSTVFSWTQPSRRHVGIRPTSAWAFARAYAKLEKITKDEAFNRLFEDVPAPAAAEGRSSHEPTSTR